MRRTRRYDDPGSSKNRQLVRSWRCLKPCRMGSRYTGGRQKRKMTGTVTSSDESTGKVGLG